MMKKITIILLLLTCKATYGQSFLNGDFEFNTAGVDHINLLNVQFNALMSNCNAFGTLGNMDIITSAANSGGPQRGNWFVALTGGGTDILALSINAPLISGNIYSISFYDKMAIHVALPIEIGLSTSNNSFGDLIYTAPSSAVSSIWTQRIFTFVAPNNGQFLTVRQQGSLGNWVHVDNFTFGCPINLNLGSDTTLCHGQTVTLNGGSSSSYLWSNGSTTSSINVTTSGTYWLEVSNGQCTVRDSINITFNPIPRVDLGNDTTICQGQTVTLIGDSATSYLWSNGSTSSSINVTTSGTYWLEVSNGPCSDRDSINITFFPVPTVNLGNDSVLCQGQEITLNAGGGVSYLWSNGSTSSAINVTTSGTYWLEVSNGLCSYRDSINITFHPVPIVNLGNDITLCEGKTITLSGGSASSYNWSNGSTSSSINVSTSGTYWVEVRNNCVVHSDTIRISFEDCDCNIYIPNAFSPNGDGLNDQFELQSRCRISQYELVIYNRWGQQLFKSSDITQSWDGHYQGELLPIGEYVYHLYYYREGLGPRQTKGSFRLLR